MQEGESYLICMTNGFVFVGTYLRPEGLNDVVLCDAHFVTKCGNNTDWGQFSRTGPASGFIVNKVGNDETTLSMDFRLWSCKFDHMDKIRGKTR